MQTELVTQMGVYPVSIGSIIRIVFDADLRSGHKGLTSIAKSFKVDTNELAAGEYVIFVNRAMSALKMYAAGNVVAHLKMPPRQRIDPDVIRVIPEFFNGKAIDYDSALKTVLEKKFPTYRQ